MNASVTDVLCRHFIQDRFQPNGKDSRGAATKRLYESGLPSRHTEEWKYTPIEQVLSAEFTIAPVTTEPSNGAAELVASVVDLAATRLVIVNGEYAPSLSRTDQVDVDVVKTTGGSALPNTRVDGMAALNAAVATETLRISVADRAVLDAPIQVIYCAHSVQDDTALIVHPSVQLIVGQQAQASLIETYVGSIAPTTTNSLLSIDLHRSAALHHVRVQTDGPTSTNLGFIRMVQAAASKFHSTSVMTGSRIGRLGIDLTIEGERATADLAGLTWTRDDQQHDHTVTIDHASSHATTSQLYKSIVDDHGTGSFTGHIIVGQQTLGTNAHQVNRSLLLSQQATANSRPWLEILADDVRCAHGSTVGRLDADQLFYLRSRGIPADTARAMLIDAFASEITNRCGTEIAADLSRLLTTVPEHA